MNLFNGRIQWLVIFPIEKELLLIYCMVGNYAGKYAGFHEFSQFSFFKTLRIPYQSSIIS